MKRVMVIDDDIELCELVFEYLAPEGFVVETAEDGLEVADRALADNYAIVVLDVMLPGINGFGVLRRIRAKSRTHVLMLTARGADVDRIVGLEFGADDHLPKPFNPRELVKRIQAILRRTRRGAEAKTDVPARTFAVGDICLNTDARPPCRSAPSESS